MTNSALKSPLDFDQYSLYEIPQDYLAYKIVFTDIEQEESDELELQYTLQGYKLFHSQMQRSQNGNFELLLIVAKCNLIF